MQKKEDDKITSEEIKKEFQLERMIVFSDAVFAIVITLMAIEIRLPDGNAPLTDQNLPGTLLHLFPVIMSYCVSFFFIGLIWVQHLKMFSILKDYDTGLIVRNLVLLFFVGFFPFSATIITKARGSGVAMFVYFLIILLCIAAQYFLYDYIIIKKPALRINAEIETHREELRKKKISLIIFSCTAVVIAITYVLISDPLIKPLSVLWMAIFPLIYQRYYKKTKKKVR